MTVPSSETLHASCVAIGGRAVLITGPSGSGKSDLALRLIDRGASLVSDDYTHVRRSGDALLATAPANIVGMIEVRGVGLVTMTNDVDVPVALLIAIAPEVDRFPHSVETEVLAGLVIPRCYVVPFEFSAPIKVALLLEMNGLR